jgi:3,4-dehydroadipyl-CoA semialdehyde dehydrogenase
MAINRASGSRDLPVFLKNLVAGEWITGTGTGVALIDPVLGEELARVSSSGVDLAKGFAFARDVGGSAMRALTYGERAAALARCVGILKANRERYFEIAQANSGTTKADSATDIDGAIFTLNYYARAGAALGQSKTLLDGPAVDLVKDGAFKTRHVLVPARGAALCINAFNFPAWGLWEKASPALLSGVPIIIKPATTTAWLAQQMVEDVVVAGALPDGAISIICGNSDGLLDQLAPFDLLSFTGSAKTASLLRNHRAVSHLSVRANIESDSVNSALLGPSESPSSESFSLLVRETVREMTAKSGQKCTAIRRVFVPESAYDGTLEAISAELSRITMGNPRNPSVQMGSLVSREQQRSVQIGIRLLQAEASLIFDGSRMTLVDADPALSAFVAPHLLGIRNGADANTVHEIEVFGPVATIIGYRDLDMAFRMIRAGGGSLVSSIYSGDPDFAATAALELAPSHGRVHAISPNVATTHTGHGNVMPMSIHGGPGRAGGGEELGGLRALGFFHRRCALQTDAATQDLLARGAIAWP